MKAIKTILGSHSHSKDDAQMFAWNNRWKNLLTIKVPSALPTHCQKGRKQNQKDITTDIKCPAQCLVCTAWSIHYAVVMASKSKAKEKDAMRASKTNFWISAGWSETQEKNSCKRTRAFLGSQLGESSREMRALARAARMAKNIRNQSHDGLWHRAEQMN